MKTSIIAASLLSTLALATPVQEEKRAYVTSWDIETATVTVTGAGWGNWGQAQPTQAATTTQAPAQQAPPQAAVHPGWGQPQGQPQGQSADSQTWSEASSPTAQASAAAQTGDVSGYAAPILKQHNLHRANHSAPDLVWDDALAGIAATIAASCVYAHDTSTGGGGYGQNIGAGAPSDQIDAMITNEMYNDEIGYYPGYGGEPDMGQFENWGHFSQIVWKDTTKLGCATQYCPGGLGNTGSGISPYFTVCNYEPAGNFGGQYGANVLAPQGDSVVTIASGQ